MNRSLAAGPKATPAGSALWWLLLFTEPDRRDGVRALLGIRGELVDTVERTSEPAVAAARLAWWREETRRYGSGREEHPATRALAASPGGEAVEPEYLEEMVDGAQMDALRRPYATFPELRLYCHRTSGLLLELCAAVVGASEPGNERALRKAAHRIGIGTQLAGLACRHHAEYAAGRLYLPAEWLSEAGVDTLELSRDRPGPGLDNCLERLAALGEAEIDAGLAAMPPGERPRHRNLLTAAALARRRLAEARGRRWAPPATRRRVSAAARTFGDLVTAWRTARHSMRTTENP